MTFLSRDRAKSTLALLLLLLLPLSMHAQATPLAAGSVIANSSASENEPGPYGIVSAQRGFNLSTVLTGQHDSSAGWQGIMTPVLSYRWNEHWSWDLSTPIYLDASTTVQGGTASHPTSTATSSFASPGDTALAAHLQLASPNGFTYTVTPTLTLPSGDSNAGFGTGSVQYDLNNHFQLGESVQPQVDLGIGNSSATFNRRVRKTQNSTGTISHFEAGLGITLPHAVQFSASAYELLPIGEQSVYSTRLVSRNLTNRVSRATSLAEDNGFNTALDVPIQSHVTLSGFYSHSLRQQLDTVGVSVTVSVRGASSQ